MTACQYSESLLIYIVHISKEYHLWTVSERGRHPLYDQVILGECASFIEATDVNFPCEGDSEGLSTKDSFLNKLYDGIVHSH